MNHAHHRNEHSDSSDALLTPRQVASIFHVDPTTVRRWAQAGKISYTRTPGGHHRYHNSEIQELARSSQQERHSPS
ncbi:BldC family transcriptional regulator [Rhodococcus sp. APC 3903]|uniref:BldC family transcriptional regulator n=1 Tax=Rhodococcus sp. APC 3903 TaxID=3035193 RepID=UPI0025B45344|nr:BldC family transcriptional regulator [Rhodococcus sp. APC 3903]MDN3460822.1 BldC family transcriptional regulator [Rhodococcus sp. APC 3903]